MAQERIKINGIVIRQPDEDMGYDFETTYTEDSGRVQSGVMHSSPLFTVESLSYEASDMTVEEMRTILRQIANGGSFTLHYWSPYYGAWRDDKFYVGKGSLNIGTLKASEERYTKLSFNMVGVNPIK